MSENFDVAIVGGGVVGCAVARELSRYQLKVVVLERASDVARGTSGKNSGVVHTGINVPVGSVKGKYNVRGAEIFEQYCEDLNVPFERCGKVIVALTEDQIPDLEVLKEKGESIGVKQLEIIDHDRLKEMEPNIEGAGAINVPTAAIACPYTLNIALAESSAASGVEFMLDTPVTGISGEQGDFELETPNGNVSASLIVNSAGLFADKIARMVGVTRWRIWPCRGEYLILDKSVGGMINSMVYPVPPKGGAGLGIHITPTTDGNILLGPSADYTNDGDDVRTTAKIRRQLLAEAGEFLPGLAPRHVITAYSGMRPKLVPVSVGGFGDFVVEEVPEALGVMQLVGIESPGLTAAPAIAEDVTAWALERIPAEKNPGFKKTWSSVRRTREEELEVIDDLIGEDSDYGEIMCRCEMVTKKEIVDSINNELDATSLNAIKYRSRATMGRCQGGFCGPRIVDLLLENGKSPESLTLKGGGSWLFMGTTEDLRAEGKALRAGAK
ncbi:MAG TPA: FAD/NAD(P)-binding oxidoreductase [Dehalococcoidia bacterium]|nr:FAD/NAD(P)-binding oxidoreductase [Dehalococcoidia bacterium]HIK89702.1 FAD/NAD(P)-binding oxidoreductase [Dehalococcoidia bacterium]